MLRTVSCSSGKLANDVLLHAFRIVASRGLIAAVAVVSALFLLACLACVVWCCYRSRRGRSGGDKGESAQNSAAGRELSEDPLALSGTPLTALSKSGQLTAGEDDGLVGVNYVRAKYHDLSSLPDEDGNSDSGLLWNNVMSWMCGRNQSSVRIHLCCLLLCSVLWALGVCVPSDCFTILHRMTCRLVLIFPGWMCACHSAELY